MSYKEMLKAMGDAAMRYIEARQRFEACENSMDPNVPAWMEHYEKRVKELVESEVDLVVLVVEARAALKHGGDR